VNTALIAIGGNSLIRAGERGTIEEQLANAHSTAKSIVQMIKQGWEVVITHGNGPQAGAALLRSERASGEVYTHTLDMCVATTQSEIGYILQRALEKELKDAGLTKEVLIIPTMVEVDPNDKAFLNPTKPIGPFYSREDAEQKKRRLGWNVVEDSQRGWRRVVPSPEPKSILELSIIKKVMDLGIVTIALGGGGIPIIRDNQGNIIGSEAVIDKDRSSALLANALGVDLFIISTEAEQVYINYKKKNQKGLSQVSLHELEKYQKEGQFPPGSMGPKIESVISFIKNGGKEAIITSYEYLTEALEGKAGTKVVVELLNC
jgi:carbamate kinase